MKNCKRSEGVTKEAVKKYRLQGLRALWVKVHPGTWAPELDCWKTRQTGGESWLHKAILWPPPHTYDGPNTHTDRNNRNTGTRWGQNGLNAHWACVPTFTLRNRFPTAQGESIGAGYTPVMNPDIGFRLWNCWSCLALSSTVMAQMSRLPAGQKDKKTITQQGK